MASDLDVEALERVTSEPDGTHGIEKPRVLALLARLRDAERERDAAEEAATVQRDRAKQAEQSAETWRKLAADLRTQESRICGALLDARDVPVQDYAEAVRTLVRQRDEARDDARHWDLLSVRAESAEARVRELEAERHALRMARALDDHEAESLRAIADAAAACLDAYDNVADSETQDIASLRAALAAARGTR